MGSGRIEVAKAHYPPILIGASHILQEIFAYDLGAAVRVCGLKGGRLLQGQSRRDTEDGGGRAVDEDGAVMGDHASEKSNQSAHIILMITQGLPHGLLHGITASIRWRLKILSNAF